jgi:hypothetical protein
LKSFLSPFPQVCEDQIELRNTFPKEQEQLAILKEKLEADEAVERDAAAPAAEAAPPARNRDEFEGGYGGQEDLEDRYATTYGAH